MPDRVRRVPLAAEVYPFQAEVGGDQDLEAGRACENRRIVPDPGADHPLAAGSFGLAAYVAN